MHVTAHLDVDAVALEQDDTVTVMLDLAAPVLTQTAPRVDHTVVVVLDRSGSMGGVRINAARTALISLVDRLSDTDQFGLVVFDDSSRVAVPTGPLGQLGRDEVRRTIQAIVPGGSTDLSSGYLRGLQEARRVATSTGATLILLSDGQANAGVVDPLQLRSLAEQARTSAVTTSTIGIGTGYDERILAALAEGGAGNHSFAEHADAAGVALAGEIEGLLNKTVQAASLTITAGPEIQAITLLNDLPFVSLPDAMQIDLGDFYSGEQRRVIVRVEVPARAGLGVATIGEFTLRYVEVPALIEHAVTLPLAVNVVPGDVAAGRVRNPEVVHEELLLQIQISKKQAEAALSEGDSLAAQHHLGAAADLITAAPMMTPDLADESRWLSTSLSLLRDRDDDYNRKRMRSSSSKGMRGRRTSAYGGETGDE
jgi:Ca-activated chloride channel family protein